MFKGLKKLRTAGQSLWMNHVSRELFQDEVMMRHIGAETVTGISISPQSVCNTLYNSHIYDIDFRGYLQDGLYGDTLAHEILFEDVRFAADQLRHVFDKTDGVDGWAVFPVSPLLADHNKMILPDVISAQYTRVRRPNALITIPGHTDGLQVISDVAFDGIPINIGPIYTPDQFEDVAEAYLCGIERRLDKGLSPSMPVFITIAISELAAAFSEEMNRDETLRKTISVAREFYELIKKLHCSTRWVRAHNHGAPPLRLVWLGLEENCSTGIEEILFSHLVAPLTIAAMSEREMANYHNNKQRFSLLSDNTSNNERQSTDVAIDNIARILQDGDEGKKINAWINLFEAVAKKSADLVQIRTSLDASCNRQDTSENTNDL